MTVRPFSGYQIVFGVGFGFIVVPYLVGAFFLYWAVDLVMIVNPFWDALVNGWIWVSTACWVAFVLFGIYWMCLRADEPLLGHTIPAGQQYQSAETAETAEPAEALLHDGGGDCDRYQAPAPLTDDQYRSAEPHDVP